MRLRHLLLLGLLISGALFLDGCKKTLQPGGAYAPVVITTNAGGVTVTNVVDLPDMAFYQTEAAFKTAYDLTDGIFKWERDNRLILWGVSPSIKHSLDAIRPTAAAIVKQYGIARTAYKANPTPAGLDLMNTILAKMEQIRASAEATQETVKLVQASATLK